MVAERFDQYVQQVYFADFVPGTTATTSRNSVGHGVAHAADFNDKSACISILCIDQTFFLSASVQRTGT